MYIIGCINGCFQHQRLSIEFLKPSEQIYLQHVSYPLLGYPSAGTGEPINDQNQSSEMTNESTQRVEIFTNIPEVIEHKNCYALQVNGDSLKEIGIFDGDYSIVEKSFQPPSSGTLIVARLYDRIYVRRFVRRNGNIFLESENPEYERIPVQTDDFEIIGEVIQAIHNFRQPTNKSPFRHSQ